MVKKNLTSPANTNATLAEAQTDMRRGYANGSIGVIVSGLMWLISAIVSQQYSPEKAVWALLIAGMLIHPVSVIINKIIGLAGPEKENPLGALAMEGTAFMIMCIPIAYGLSFQHVEWFFQGMLLIIGGRYLTFSSIFGIKLFWILGAVLGAAAFFLFSNGIQSFGTLLTGSFIEITFGLFMFFFFRRNNNNA